MIGAAELLTADEAVPQRDLLLDPVVLQERIASALDTTGHESVVLVRVRRVKYRVGISLRVVADVRVDGRIETVSARTFRPHAVVDEFEKRRGAARPVGALAGIGMDRELATVFWTFPNDRRLDLSALVDTTGPLRRFVGRHWSTAALVSLMPEKLAIMQCRDGDGVTLAYSKRYIDDVGARTALVHRRLRHAGIEAPRVRAWVPSLRTLVVDPVPGTVLADLSGPAAVVAAAQLGATLARLHGAGTPRAHFARHDRDRIRTSATIVGKARPVVVDAAAALSERLVAGPVRTPDVCLHGDVHLRNALATADRVALIDLDNVARGPAAADLGGLLAVFAYQTVVGNWAAARGQAMTAALLAGYEDVRDLPEPGALRWHTAVSLLVERALRAVNRMRMAGIEHLDAIIAEANAVLDGTRDV